MAQAASLQQNILNILKNFYTDEKFQQLLFRNDPLLAKVRTKRIGGKQYGFSVMYGRGGAVSGDATVAAANASSGAPSAEFLVPPGQVFSIFNITQKSILAGLKGSGNKANYIEPLTELMFGATEALRKTMAAVLYGSGYGELGQTQAAFTTVNAAGNIFNFSADVQIKMDVGTVFSVTNSGVSTLPSATLRSGQWIVTNIGSVAPGTSTYPVTFGPYNSQGAVETWTATDWVCLLGGRDGGNAPNMPSGLGAWLPAYGQRTGATWNTYIGTPFYGVTRSVFIDRLAGGYYFANSGEKTVDAIMEGVRLVRRAGGVPDWIVMNDLTFKKVLQEVNGQTTIFQDIIDDVNAGDNNISSRGGRSIDFRFEASYLKTVLDTPYCPPNLVYILDSTTFEFVSLTNTDQAFGDPGIAIDNRPGRPDVTEQKTPDTTFKLIVDDWLSVNPYTLGTDGTAAQITLSCFGNFVVRNPANNCVVQLY
jgi:hypothetical protein